MNTKETKTVAVIVRCMDKRHWAKLADAVQEKVGTQYEYYDLAVPGGAGLFASLQNNPDTPVLKKYVDIAMEKLGAQEIHLAVHGTSKNDSHGCGGYALGGYGDNYSSPEKSREFSFSELRKAIKTTQTMFPHVKKVKGFYVTFGEHGENLVEEVS